MDDETAPFMNSFNTTDLLRRSRSHLIVEVEVAAA